MFAATAAVVLALRIGMPAEAAVSLLEGATPAPQNTRPAPSGTASAMAVSSG